MVPNLAFLDRMPDLQPAQTPAWQPRLPPATPAGPGVGGGVGVDLEWSALRLPGPLRLNHGRETQSSGERQPSSTGRSKHKTEAAVPAPLPGPFVFFLLRLTQYILGPFFC